MQKLDITFYLVIQMIIALLGKCAAVSIEMSNATLNNAVDMAADVFKLNVYKSWKK